MVNRGEGAVAALQPALERCLSEATDLQVCITCAQMKSCSDDLHVADTTNNLAKPSQLSTTKRLNYRYTAYMYQTTIKVPADDWPR